VLLVLLVVQEVIEVHLIRKWKKEVGTSPNFDNFAKFELEVFPKTSNFNFEQSVLSLTTILSVSSRKSVRLCGAVC